MTTITIPDSGNRKQELVAIPHKMYERFLEWQETSSFKTFIPTMRDKKILSKARADYAKGNTITLNKLKRKLGHKNSRQYL